jgi:hypothetical protein
MSFLAVVAPILFRSLRVGTVRGPDREVGDSCRGKRPAVKS